MTSDARSLAKQECLPDAIEVQVQDGLTSDGLPALDWTQINDNVHQLQAILGDIKLSQTHEETLDSLFGGGQAQVMKKLVLVMDNFDQLAAHCKQVRNLMGWLL